MNRVTPFTQIEDFSSVAQDFSRLLKRPDNKDIAGEFPVTVEKYGQSAELAIKKLEEARAACETGSREQFIVFSGDRAVGLCLITNQIDIPSGLRTDAPNVSGFIAHRFRGQGLGRLSLEERMKVVETNFSNRAWTFVRDGNVISDHLVQSVGFRKTERAVPGWDGHHLYLFGDAENEQN